jgi:hypothetical protein
MDFDFTNFCHGDSSDGKKVIKKRSINDYFESVGKVAK